MTRHAEVTKKEKYASWSVLPDIKAVIEYYDTALGTERESEHTYCKIPEAPAAAHCCLYNLKNKSSAYIERPSFLKGSVVEVDSESDHVHSEFDQERSVRLLYTSNIL